MKKKVLGIFVCMLLIATMVLPLSGKMMVSTNFNNNHNEIFSEYLLLENSNYPLNNALDEYIINEMSTYHIPGLSATIVKDDDIFWTKSYGYANISNDQLVEDTTLFYLASVSKTITATAIMQLYEQDYFDLNDSINEHLPFEVNHPFYSTNITFFMLMTHTSSIKDNPAYITYITGDPTVPLGEFLEEYLTPGGEYYDENSNFYPQEPGTVYGYSNAGAGLIGYLVENISGDMFYEYCETNIFQPLDMPETAWFLADLNVSNIAVPYLWNGTGYEPYQHYSRNVYPATTLRSSVTQLRHFLMMMMNDGVYNSTQILLESTVDLMLTVHWSNFMGLIWMTTNLNGRTIWYHLGSTQGCRTVIGFEPATNIGVIVLTNSAHDRIDEIASKLFDFAENEPPNTPSDPDPPDESTDVYIYTDLSWSCSDPNGDELTYDIYFGEDCPPTTKVVSNQSNTSYDPGLLEFDTTYCWMIVAWDEFGSTSGPVWSFTTENEPVLMPDLDCSGSLSWNDVEPGSTVTGSYMVKNIGDPESLLDWEITEWPEWGNWTFTPSSGEDLTPEDGSVTVEVEVVAPDEENSEFTGEVKVVNLKDPSDNCTIDVFLATPKNKVFNFNFNLLSWLFERFPNMFPILRHMLGL